MLWSVTEDGFLVGFALIVVLREGGVADRQDLRVREEIVGPFPFPGIFSREEGRSKIAFFYIFRWSSFLSSREMYGGEALWCLC